MRSSTPGREVCGSRPQAAQRGLRRCENGAAVLHRGHIRIGRTAGSTDYLYISEGSKLLNRVGILGYDAPMRTRTWLVVGLACALNGPLNAQPAAPTAAKPAKGAKAAKGP